MTKERLWAIRQPDGLLITCELHTHHEKDFGVVLLLMGEPVNRQRFRTRLNALIAVTSLKDRSVWVQSQ
jgi:hypothetical protein